MKRALLSVIFITVFGLGSFSQSLELYHEGEFLPSGGTITVLGLESDPLLVCEVDVKNVSADSVEVKARKHEVELIPGSVNMFCWGVCFSPYIYLSPDPITIHSGEICEDFGGDYQPNDSSGVSILRYSFFDINNPADSVYFYVEYNAGPVGIEETVLNKLSFSNAYPNPAGSFTSFDFVLPNETISSSIKIHNLLGAIVKEEKITEKSGKITVNLSDLNDGVYFYSVEVNNETYVTKKLIVSR